MQRAVAELGFCDPPQRLTGTSLAPGGWRPAAAWAEWAERWHGTSTLTPRVRGAVRATLLKVGRWLEAEHPEAADPACWTRQTCAAWIAALDRMQVGDYAQRTAGLKGRAGKPLEAATKATQLSAVRTFFRDCQEWEWIPQALRPAARAGHPAQHRRPARPRPPGDRRRDLGEADVGRAEPRGRRPPAVPGRELLPAGAGSRGHAGLAVLRPAQRRDRPAADRLHPLAARRHRDHRRLAAGPGPRRGLPAGRACPQDRHRVHQAGRPGPGPGPRRLAGRPPGPAEVHRPPHRRARRPAVRLPRPEGLHLLHQQHGHPGALPQGRRSRRRRPREDHQPPGPLHDRQPALQRQGADDAVRAASLAGPPVDRSSTRRSAPPL